MALTSEATRTDADGGGLGPTIADLLGEDIPVRISCYDGTRVGAPNASTQLVVRSPEALRYIITAPGELGFARAYVAGEIEIDGDIFEALSLRERLPNVRLRAPQWLAMARLLGRSGIKRPPVPAEEARLHGRRHSRARDAAAISYHYDVSNEFYRMVLGPSMTYSCAVWPSEDATLEEAQAAKYDLICRKLGLRPGMRLLDVGCGWGGMVMHAARHYGVQAIGITLSTNQAEYAQKVAADAGVEGVEYRVQDYRDVDGRFDAISSIGMFEHVGLARLAEYFTHLHDLLRAEWSPPQPRDQPAARLSRAVQPARLHRPLRLPRRRTARGGFRRLAHPAVGARGTARRELARALRTHVAALGSQPRSELGRSRRVGRCGPCARVWRLYMAGSALNFEAGRNQIHQVLAVRADGGRSGLPWRPDW